MSLNSSNGKSVGTLAVLEIEVLARADIVGRDEVIGQLVFRLGRVRVCLRIDERAIREQLVGEDVHFFLGLASLANDIARVPVRERWLDAVARVVAERERNRAGRRNRGVM